MDNKSKSLLLTTAKSVNVDGERRVTFVASDNSTDRDGEHMVVETLRLPLKGGGSMTVAEIPAGGTDKVDIPLLTDHALYAVDKTIGSVRRASYEDGKLIFEAGISSRDYAQDVFKLIDEGHLDNSWSISVNDYDYNYETGAISDGEIIEVSLVTRGSNKDAQVLSVKSAKEKSMDEESKKVEETTEVKDETVTEEVEETTEPTVEAEAETKDKTVEAEEAKDEGEAEKPAEESTEEIKEKTMDKEITKSVARNEADQTVTAKVANTDYLKSKIAVKDFTEAIVATKGMGTKAALDAWKAKLTEKGITGDAILPTQIEQIFFKTWQDDDSILGTFRTINANAAALNAFTGEGEGIRAKGHRKGDTKAGQTVTNIRRDLKAKIIYKMLAIDLQDLLDDQTGELLRFRVEELARRVANEIAVGAVLGDGRSEPASDSDPDYRTFDGTRGLWSMAADLNAIGTSSYAAAVANVVANVATDNLYDKIVKTLTQVEDLGAGKAIVVPRGSIGDLRLLKGEDGHYLFTPGGSVEDAIEARIFEMDMAGSGYDVIAYAVNGYALYATNEMVRTQFNINNNTDTMLVERSVAGSLYGHRAAAGYASGASA